MITERQAAGAQVSEMAPADRLLAVASIAVDLSGSVIAWNAMAERLFGWPEAEVTGRRLPIVPRELWPDFEQLLTAAARGLPIPDHAARRQRRDGRIVDVELSVAPIRGNHARVEGLLFLVTEAGPARGVGTAGPMPHGTTGSARMEAVGRLAGGVAHDFNNILTAIAGYAGLLARDLAPDDPMQSDVAEIRKATERATRLTRQLLAFGRREAQEARLLNPNDVLTDLLPMLRQLIGEDIELVTGPAADLPPIYADAGQIEQILVNLALNARDAMPRGGTIVVATAATTLDETFTATHPGARPGNFVRLTVQDTGMGMDAIVLEHMFEPYFTTKEPGRGTGLGLSTVYGIVKQSDGYIWADSALGRGTLISVYLPAR